MVLNTEWSQVEVIDLINDGNGLGFILVGGRSTGVVIKALTPGGVGERDGRLQCGDHLLQIGEVNLRGFSSEQVATVLRQTGAQVRLIVARPIEPTAIDYQTLASHAPIIPTKLLSDPEELSRHLFQNPSYATSATSLGCGGATGGGGVGHGAGASAGAGCDATVAMAAVETIAIHSGYMQHSPTTTPDADLADLPLPPLPLAGSGSVDAAATGGRTLPKDLDIVPFSLVSPPPTTALLPTFDRIAAAVADDDDNRIESVIAGHGADKIAKSPATPAAFYSGSGECDGDGVVVDFDCFSSASSNNSYIDSPETETYVVELHKNVYGLGITVAGYVCEEEDLSGIFVKSIIEGSAAETSGQIQINDRIVAVDGRSLAGVTNHQAVEILRNTDIEVHLTLERFLRGRKFEHLQVALTELKDGDTQSQNSLPASPSIATLSWLPPKSDADSIVTDGGAIIMEYADLPSRDTVDSNMSHVLDHSEHSNVPADDVAAPQKPLTNGNALHDSDNDAQVPSHAAINGSGSKTPTNEPLANVCKLTSGNIADDHKKVIAAATTTVVPQAQGQAQAQKKPTSSSSPSAESLKVAWKSLGISLEGTVDVECGIEKRPHHYIRSILEDGPVGRQGILKPGDELLQVNEHKLQGLKHIEVVKILKELPTRVKLVCARGPTAPSIINTSQNPEAFESRSLLPGGHQCLQNLLTTKAQSESSLYTSSTATLTDQQRSKSLENVSGLALWSLDVTYVQIEKTEQGFGFSILDYQDPLDSDGSVIVIRGLIRGGSAEATNEIFPGDRLVSVGEHSLNGLDLDEAVTILKGMPLGTTRLGICRPLSTSDSNSNIASPVGDSPST